MAKGLGRGRGISTNVPELELIEQVRSRPLLYDKNVKDYRKPGFSDQAWSEVADALQTTATNCKKRWKSLRDTFIKYYRLEMQKKNSRKNKNWIYYKDLSFLMPHVELYRLDDSRKTDNSSVTIYMKDDENYLEDSMNDEKPIFFTEERPHLDVSNDQVTYQIKINDDEYEDEEHDTENQYEEEERLEDGTIIDIEDENQIEENKEISDKPNDDHTTYMLLEEANEHSIEESNESKMPSSTKTSTLNSLSREEFVSSVSRIPSNSTTSEIQRNITDPDERYLLSCLPAFKRFTPQQKAYVRMGIEKLFYEVEFENIEEPKNKRRRNS